MSETKAKNSNWSQDKRIEFIDFRLQWSGRINRGDLTDFFGISVPQASLDLARYIEWRPANVFYDKSSKAYLKSKEFQPLFSDKGSKDYLGNLLALTQNIIKDDECFIGWRPPCDVLPSLERLVPDQILSTVLEAIRNQRVMQVSYLSMARETPSNRSLSPHAIIFDGYRWHVRAYCQDRAEFRDFVLARILSALVTDVQSISSDQDISWNTFVTLIFTPSPSLSEHHQKAIEFDYGMPDGKIEIPCRQALLLYALRRYDLLKDYIQNKEQLSKLNDQHVVLSNYDDICLALDKEVGA